MILTKILQENAKKFPGEPALTMQIGFRIVSMTYKDVYDTARKIALLLEKEGITKGDKVLLLAPNSPYWVCAFWGMLLVGAVVVPLNIQSTSDMVEKIAKQTEAKLFFANRFYRNDSPCGIKRFDLDVIKPEIDHFEPKNFIHRHVTPDDLVEILYTSGTTGDPKGVMLTHKNLYASLKSASLMHPFEVCKERMLSILPLSHIFEQAVGFLLPSYYAGHIIYAHNHGAIRELLQEYKITKMIAVPEFLKIMMRKIEGAAEERGKEKIFKRLLHLSLRVKRQWFSRLLFHSVLKNFGGKLDTIVSAGAPLDEILEKNWNALGITLFQGYGLTETAPLVTSNTYKEHKFGSVGKVAPGVTLRIANDGEIQVKGANVFSGYFKNKEKTREVFTDDHFFKTGDVGELDKDGFLFIKGRRKYMILGPGGQNVFPEDIEEILNEFPGVQDSCVVGLEKQNGMIEIHAVFLLEKTFDGNPKLFVDDANAKLASYQKISGFSVWPEDDFPRTATKKVKKDLVIAFLQEQIEGGIVSKEMGKTDPLISLLSQVTGVTREKIKEETTLGELHVDSLMRIELLTRIEEEFTVLLGETLLTSQTTVAGLATMIKEKPPVKKLPPLRRWPRRLVVRFFRSILQSFLFLIMKIFVRLRVKGLQNLQKIDRATVFMPNHISYMDPFVVTAALPRKIRRRLSFAAGNDVLYGYYKHLVFPAELLFNVFPFPRKEGENIKLGLEYMGKMLDKNFSVVVFPEGKVSENATLLPLKKGAGLIGVEMETWVVPVKIEGTNIVLPYEKVVPRRRARVTVTFGKPMKFVCDESYDAVTQKIEAAMKKL